MVGLDSGAPERKCGGDVDPGPDAQVTSDICVTGRRRLMSRPLPTIFLFFTFNQCTTCSMPRHLQRISTLRSRANSI